MANVSEGNYLGDVLKYEAPNSYSRETETVLSGQDLAVGTVVGRVAASGKIKILNQDGSDGSEDAVGVMAEAVDATGGDTPGAMIARHAIVSDAGLVWPDGIDAAEIATASAQLKALGILVRSGA